MFLGLSLTGCEPMEDIHNEVDSTLGEPIVQSAVAIELTEDDYTTDVEEGGLGLSFPNFNSVEDARALIPQFLSANYPAWGSGSLALVTFNVYSPLVVEQDTVTSAGYEAIGLDVEYFTGFGQIENFLEYQFPEVSEGTFVELTYNVLATEIPYTLTNGDFDLIEDELENAYPEPASSAANFNNFDRREGRDAYWSNEMILEAINVVLSDEFDDIEGQTYSVAYPIYDGDAGTESMNVRFDGNAYVLAGGTAYDVSNDDFDIIGAEFADKYEDPASSAAQYSNFERRSSNAAYWSDDMILEALNYLLNEKYPNATEGEKFDVTYRTYDGSSGEELISLVLSNGEFVVDEEAFVSTIEQTTGYSFLNNNWRLPVTVQPEDYVAMGQRFPNFDDQDEAIYKLATYLELQFPYAEEGDIIPVAYEFYSGSTNTRYANFIFEDGEFVLVPSVIEESLQFGHNGITWEPDNTIEYTLTEADFETVGDALIDVYPDPADNAGYFGSFNRIPGSTDYWSDEMLLEAITIVLNDLEPNPEEGQKYVVYFATYTGSLDRESLSVIYQDGEWVLNE
ncbi:hypothetical protein [Salinimicrobium terrae]|uniref:hypothetical protein n=1 Tax=Salinimicrobium terrae TaxID=470866 RepID=UPI001FE1BDB5|nr:hypothetical protein [Salinimicrobium terrae]